MMFEFEPEEGDVIAPIFSSWEPSGEKGCTKYEVRRAP